MSFVLNDTLDIYQVVESELITTPSRTLVDMLQQGMPVANAAYEHRVFIVSYISCISSWWFVSADERFTYLTLSPGMWRHAAKCDGALHDATATDLATPLCVLLVSFTEQS